MFTLAQKLTLDREDRLDITLKPCIFKDCDLTSILRTPHETF